MIDKLLARMTKEEREKTQITKIRDEMQDTTTDLETSKGT